MDDATSPQTPADDNAKGDGVRDRLAQEVANWSADRSGRAQADLAATLGTEMVPIRVRAKRAPKAAAAKPAPAPGKPFKMSYDGVSSRDYLEQTLIRRSY